MSLLAALLFSTFAHAGCPTVRLDDDAPATIKLEGSQSGCSPHAVFTCARGSLRVSGEVKSLTTGARQITAYCRGDSRPPASLALPDNTDVQDELGEGPAE